MAVLLSKKSIDFKEYFKMSPRAFGETPYEAHDDIVSDKHDWYGRLSETHDDIVPAPRNGSRDDG